MDLDKVDIARARAAIANGEKIVARQRALILRRQEERRPSAGAESLFETMLATQDALCEHLARLERQARRDKPNLGR